MCDYQNRGLTGLANLGNTCYINSALQVMNHVYELQEYIYLFFNHKEVTIGEDVNIIFLKEWYDLTSLMWNRNCTISPNRFISVIHAISKNKKNELFTGYQQNDSTEFVFFIIDIFHNALKNTHDVGKLFKYHLHELTMKTGKPCVEFSKYLIKYHENNYSIIDSLFGIYCKMDIIEEKNYKQLSYNFENFYILDIALTSVHLQDCLQNHFSDESMNEENDNQYYDDNEKCYKDVIKKYAIYHCPKYLIIQLKRWDYNLRKNQRIIHYDNNEIDLEEFVHEDRKNFMETKYSLFGIINHSGNILGGHYFSFIKNMNEKWYLYNDTQVQEIPKQKLLCNKNYCLIYRRK